MQWNAEIQRHTHPGALTVTLYYGNDRDRNPDKLRRAGIVLTTYSTIETDFRRQQYGFKRQGELQREPSPLHALTWHRIILDEGGVGAKGGRAQCRFDVR